MSVPSIDGVSSSPVDRVSERSVREPAREAQGADGPAAVESAVDRKPQATTRSESTDRQDERHQADQDRAKREDDAVRAVKTEESLSRLREATVDQRAKATLLDNL